MEIEIKDLQIDDSVEVEEIQIDNDVEIEDLSLDNTEEIGDLETEGILSELDPTVPSHVKAITETNISFWNNRAEMSNDDIRRIMA